MAAINQIKLGTVRLDTISYAGGDIGDDLKYEVGIEGQFWRGQLKHVRGTTVSVSRDFAVTSQSNHHPQIPVVIRITERDTGPDDTAIEAKYISFDLRSPKRQATVVSVPVKEGRTTALFVLTFELVKPTFFLRLWNNYSNASRVIDKKEEYAALNDQCAIRLSDAMYRTEPGLLRGFGGATSKSEYDKWDSTKYFDYALRAKQFGPWIDESLSHRDHRIGRTRKGVTQGQISGNSRATGILYFPDVPHVDLWHWKHGTKSGAYFGRGDVWFWAVK